MNRATPEAPPSGQRRSIPWLAWLGRHEFGMLLTLGLIAGGIWIFAELADAIEEQSTRHFDRMVLLAMRTPNDLADPRGPRWVEELARDITGLGGVGILSFITLACVGFLGLHRRYRLAGLVVIAVGGGFILNSTLKYAFQRPRPDLVPHGSYVRTTSFPSGHSLSSAATYLTLGALLARSQNRRRIKAYLLLLAILITVAVGVSRVYLGVHWPTDVLAGWTLGAAWALLCWSTAHYLQRQGAVEGEAQSTIGPPTDSQTNNSPAGGT